VIKRRKKTKSDEGESKDEEPSKEKAE